MTEPIKYYGDYFHSNGITIADANRLCIQMGLKPNRYILMAAKMLVFMK